MIQPSEDKINLFETRASPTSEEKVVDSFDPIQSFKPKKSKLDKPIKVYHTSYFR
jgi:hypothetical protein